MSHIRGVPSQDLNLELLLNATNILAEHVEAVDVKKCWADWDLVSVDTDGGTETDKIAEEGRVEIDWSDTQEEAAPTVTVSPPDRYIGGTYVIEVTGTGGPHSDTKRMLLDIQ